MHFLIMLLLGLVNWKLLKSEGVRVTSDEVRHAVASVSRAFFWLAGLALFVTLGVLVFQHFGLIPS